MSKTSVHTQVFVYKDELEINVLRGNSVKLKIGIHEIVLFPMNDPDKLSGTGQTMALVDELIRKLRPFSSEA